MLFLSKMFVYILLGLIVILKVKGAVTNATEFDDGATDFNITSNTTKYVTIPTNSNISYSVLTFSGNKTVNYTEGYSASVTGTLYDITLIPGTNTFYATAENANIYKLNYTGSILSNISIDDNSGIGFTFPSVADHNYYGLKAVNSDIIYILNQGNFDYVLKLNYTRCVSNSSCVYDYYNLTDSGYSTSDYGGLWANNAETLIYLVEYPTTNWTEINITNCADNNCRNSANHTHKEYVVDDYAAIDSLDGTTFYTAIGGPRMSCSGFKIEKITKSGSGFSKETYKHETMTSLVDTGEFLRCHYGIAFNHTNFYITDSYVTEELVKFDIKYPKNVVLKINNTVVFNQPNTLNTTNASHPLNNSLIQDYLTGNNQLPFLFEATDWGGYVRVNNLIITYDTVQSAILQINSPTQITKSVNSGESTTQTNINISNEGDYNATNISFITVSSLGTPNYNDSITFTCEGDKTDVPMAEDVTLTITPTDFNLSKGSISSGNLTSLNANDSNTLNISKKLEISEPSFIMDINFTVTDFHNFIIEYLAVDESNISFFNYTANTYQKMGMMNDTSNTFNFTNISVTESADFVNNSIFKVRLADGPGASKIIAIENMNVYRSYTTNNSMLCNVTFSSLTQNPEPDEKLKFKAKGSNTGEILFSNGIDVDVTVSTTTPTGGGGGGGIFTRCNWKISRPANQLWTGVGWYGYATRPQVIQIYNNETFSQSFTFTQQGLQCDFAKDNIVIEGSSFGVNEAVCQYPEVEDTGKIIIQGGGCDSSINVAFKSNEFGWFLLMVTGGINVLYALAFWGVLIGGVILIARG